VIKGGGGVGIGEEDRRGIPVDICLLELANTLPNTNPVAHATE